MVRAGWVPSNARPSSKEVDSSHIQAEGRRTHVGKAGDAAPCTTDSKVGFGSSNKRKMSRMLGRDSSPFSNDFDLKTTRKKTVKVKTKKIKLSFDQES